MLEHTESGRYKEDAARAPDDAPPITVDDAYSLRQTFNNLINNLERRRRSRHNIFNLKLKML